MRAAAFAIALTLLPIAASAQIGNPGFMAPNTRFAAPGVPAQNQPNTADTLFAQLAAAGGMAEVNFAELATDRAQASNVGDFAQLMIDDHSAASDTLADLATQSNIELPEELDPAHAAMREQLADLDAGAFDLAYMRGQVVDHQKTATLLMWEIDSGQDAALQQFAAQTLPTVLGHLRMARAIVEELAKEQVTQN